MTADTCDCWACIHSYYEKDDGKLVIRCEYGEITSAWKECKRYE